MIALLEGDFIVVCSVCRGSGTDSSDYACVLCWGSGSLVRRIDADDADVELTCEVCAGVHVENVLLERLIYRTWTPACGWTIVWGPRRDDGAFELTPRAICSRDACRNTA